MRFENQVAIITGGGNGMGRATALRFAKEGARVVVADIESENAARVADEIREGGGTRATCTPMCHSANRSKRWWRVQ